MLAVPSLAGHVWSLHGTRRIRIQTLSVRGWLCARQHSPTWQFLAAGNQPRTTGEAEVHPDPLQHDNRAVAKSNQKIDMHHQPGDPRRKTFHVGVEWPHHIGHCGMTPDRRHISFIEVVEFRPLSAFHVGEYLPRGVYSHLDGRLRHPWKLPAVFDNVRQVTADKDIRMPGWVQVFVNEDRASLVHLRSKHFSHGGRLHASRP